MRRRTERSGFTLIELMIIVAILGVWAANIRDLLPESWKAFYRISRDHAASESLVRLHAHLAHDLEDAVVTSDSPRSLVLALSGGRTVRYVTDAQPSRVRREEPGRAAVFPDARLAVVAPSAGGPWVVRLESTVGAHRPPPVLVSVWRSHAPDREVR